MIRIEELTFQYPRSAFSLMIESLGFARGETVALVGPSGCGKTTLLKLVAGILVPRSGVICVGNESLGVLSDAERRRFRIKHVGFVFQDFGLVDYLNVLDNVLLPCFVHPGRTLDAEVRARASRLVADVGLVEKERSRVRVLSHGEQQRVAICRAMLNRPPCILADEPTGNLDYANASHILDLLFTQAHSTGATLVMVTHDQGLLGRFDRVVDIGTPGRAAP